MTTASIVWTGDAIAYEVPGCYVFDRWKPRSIVADEDCGICCCVTCHDQRFGHPIGGREARGWNGDGLSECPSCQRQREAVARPVGEAVAGRCSDGELLSRAHARGGYNAVRLLLDMNPWMEKSWLGE